jgi:futalosine hydrolase
VIVVCAATQAELDAASPPAGFGYPTAQLLTGVGIPHTLASLSAWWGQQGNSYPILLLNAGICGAYDPAQCSLGQVVRIVRDGYGDIGVQQANSSFTSALGMGWQGPWVFENPICSLNDFTLQTANTCVTGTTVNMCTGTDSLGHFRKSLWNAQVETMESAAVFHFAQLHSIPLFALRSVSNFAGERDTNRWDIPGALHSLRQDFAQLWHNIAQAPFAQK